MKNEKGMSHIMLIILLVIIAFVIFAVIHIAKAEIQKSNIENLETDMLQIQGKTKIIAEEDNMDKDNNKLKGRKVEDYKEIQKIKELIENKVIAEDEENFSKYYIFDKLDLEEIKLENTNSDKGFYIVNYTTHEVIYSEGLTIDGKTYYKLSELKELNKKEENSTNEIVEETTEQKAAEEAPTEE